MSRVAEAVGWAAFSVFGDLIPQHVNLYQKYKADVTDLWEMLEVIEWELDLDSDSLYTVFGNYNTDFQWDGTLKHLTEGLTKHLGENNAIS